MSDYLAQIKIKNGRIWSLMIQHGIESQSELARLACVHQGMVGHILNFKKSPMNKDGTWSSPVLKIANVFGVLPDELFSPEQLTLSVESNKRDYLITHDEAMRLADRQESYLALPETEKDADMMAAVVSKVLDALAPREKKVLEMRFGLNGEEQHNLEEVGQALDVSRERIRQIEAKALRKLRNKRELRYNLLDAQGIER